MIRARVVVLGVGLLVAGCSGGTTTSPDAGGSKDAAHASDGNGDTDVAPPSPDAGPPSDDRDAAGTITDADADAAVAPTVDADADAADAPTSDAGDAPTSDAANAPTSDAGDAPSSDLADASALDGPRETAAPDGTSDAQSADGFDGSTSSPHARLYVATVPAALVTVYPASTDLVLIDVVAGRALVDATIGGVRAMAHHDGKLLVARGFGYTRVSVLDALTLDVVRTQVLPFDPVGAVFSPDGLSLYATHDEGLVSRVRLADGVVTGEVQIPLPAGYAAGTSAGFDGLAIDATGTHLGATAEHDGEGSSVALIAISDGALTLTDQWLSQPFAASNCARFAGAPSFARDGKSLATFDNNCGGFDVYDVSAHALDANASVLLPRPSGRSIFANTVADARGQIWASNDMALYRTGTAHPNGATTFAFATEAGPLVTDVAGTTLYAFQEHARQEGIFTVDLASGTTTRLSWNLDLVRLDADVSMAIYVQP